MVGPGFPDNFSIWCQNQIKVSIRLLVESNLTGIALIFGGMSVCPENADPYSLVPFFRITAVFPFLQLYFNWFAFADLKFELEAPNFICVFFAVDNH